MGEVGRGDPLVAVTCDHAEPLGPRRRLPVRASLGDLRVVAADEVPPHDEVVRERLAADHEDARTVVGLEPDVRAAVTQEEQRPRPARLARDPRRAAQDEHRVLERGVERQVDRCTGLERDVGADERGVHDRRRADPVDLPDHHRRRDAGRGPDRQVDHLLERGSPGRGAVGQRDPQLHGVHPGALTDRELGVGDAPAGGHEVELTGPHDHVRADAVPVVDLALDRPGDGLQPRVRVGEHAHLHVLRAELVEEAPRADRRKSALRQGPPDVHVPDAAQWHVARLVALQERAAPAVADAQLGSGARLQVGHDPHCGTPRA